MGETATLITTHAPDTGVPASVARYHFGILQPVILQAGMLQTTGPKTGATFDLFLESNCFPQAWQGSFSYGIVVSVCGRVYSHTTGVHTACVIGAFCGALATKSLPTYACAQEPNSTHEVAHISAHEPTTDTFQLCGKITSCDIFFLKNKKSGVELELGTGENQRMTFNDP